jgi:hypothetical protein
MDILKDYLKFEADYTQEELERFEQSLSERDAFAVRSKRIEAKQEWERTGHKVPKEIGFHV